MFCPNCGARNAEADTTCQKCGFNLKEAAGAKFKGTMLMMNNPAAADLRRSAPPAGAAPAGPAAGAKPPAPAGSAEAQQMRAKLKGTMIGVAPPAAAIGQPQAPATPAAPATGYGQPGPGQVNAPGAALHRGGGTMIGTGIGMPGHFAVPSAGASPQPAVASPHAPTEMLPASGAAAPQNPQPPSASGGFASTYGAGLQNPGPAATIRSPTEPHPLAQTQVAAGAHDVYPSAGAGAQVGGIQAGYPEPTRAMSQFEQPQPQRPMSTLEGTMVAAGSFPPPGPRTDSMPQVAPQFSAQAGSRTDTPPMGFPAASTSQSPQAGKSKGMTILLTIMTCGLYQLFKKNK